MLKRLRARTGVEMFVCDIAGYLEMLLALESFTSKRRRRHSASELPMWGQPLAKASHSFSPMLPRHELGVAETYSLHRITASRL